MNDTPDETTTIRIKTEDRLRFDEYRAKTRRGIQGAFSVLVDLGFKSLDSDPTVRTVLQDAPDA